MASALIGLIILSFFSSFLTLSVASLLIRLVLSFSSISWISFLNSSRSPELLLNGLHLLIQVVLLLGLLHLLLDARADLLLDLEDLNLALHQLVELLQPLGGDSRSRAAPACRSA